MRQYFSTIRIPENWTGTQANAVIQLLDTISASIWENYCNEIMDDMQKNKTLQKYIAIAKKENSNTPSKSNLPPEDDLPF